MKYPNAYSGVSKLFVSEILKLIAYVCVFIAGIGIIVTTAITSVAAEEGAEAVGYGLIITTVFTIAFLVLTILSIIFQLTGLKKAGIDEEKFNSGFILAVFSLIFIVVSAILSTINGGNHIYDDLASGISEILQIAVMLFVSQGITVLAEKLDNRKLASTGKNIYLMYSIVLLVGVILKVISSVFKLDNNMSIASGIIMLASGILSIIAYIIYVVFLGRAKKMLKNN